MSDKPTQVYNAFCDCLISKLKEGDTDALKVAENFIHRQNIGALPVPGSKLGQVGTAMDPEKYQGKF